MDSPPDQQLWDALVAAEQELARCRTDFYQHAQDSPGTLRAALAAGTSWNQATALHYLSVLSQDGPELLPQLVEIATSHRWALDARQAIDRIPRDRLWPVLELVISTRLESADADEYRCFAELLVHIRAWPLLEQLANRARAIDDPDVREVAEEFTDSYAPMWAPHSPTSMRQLPAAGVVTAERLRAWGRDLFDGQQEPVAWAGGALAAAVKTLGRTPEVDEALNLAHAPDQWKHGRRVFDLIRRRSLVQDNPLSHEQTHLFALAELVAKLAHNTSGQQPPFDHDSGWRVGPTAYRLATATGDSILRKRLTTALGSWPETA